MKEIRFQKRNGVPVPFMPEDELLWSEYKENEVTTHKVKGNRKQRSLNQLRMFHVILKKVADNARQPNWNTPEKVKFSLKVALNYVEDGIVAVDTQGTVHFSYRSFSYKDLKHMEACKVFDRSWEILADVLGCSVEELLGSVGD